MNIKICDKCGRIIKGGYQLETSFNAPGVDTGVSFDLCKACHEEINVFVVLAKKVRLVIEDYPKTETPTIQGNKVPRVNWSAKTKRWRVVIYLKGKQKYIGQHQDYVEAVCLLFATEQCLGITHSAETETYMDIILPEEK